MATRKCKVISVAYIIFLLAINMHSQSGWYFLRGTNSGDFVLLHVSVNTSWLTSLWNKSACCSPSWLCYICSFSPLLWFSTAPPLQDLNGTVPDKVGRGMSAGSAVRRTCGFTMTASCPNVGTVWLWDSFLTTSHLTFLTCKVDWCLLARAVYISERRTCT